jgi:hypothetical protein
MPVNDPQAMIDALKAENRMLLDDNEALKKANEELRHRRLMLRMALQLAILELER